MKILLIESDAILRISIANMLVKQGFDVISEENGKVGLNIFKENHFDLVITDLMFTGINGMEIISNIRTKNKTIKIIAMSGGCRFLASDMLQMAISAGANVIIPKPFSIAELLLNLNILKPSNYKRIASC